MSINNKKIKYIVAGIVAVAVIAAIVIWPRQGEVAAVESAVATEAAETESSDESSAATLVTAAEETTAADEDESALANTSAEAAETVPVIQESMEASYEEWLSAAVLTGISIQYFDFEPGDIYISGTTPLADGSNSAGVYVTFTSEGEQRCIYSQPLSGERSEEGTKDIYSEMIGFATFEEVSPEDIGDAFQVTEITNMNELITQSTKVAVYEH